MSALSDALNEANTNRWSSRDIQRRSGDRINHATVAKYLNGSHGKPTEQVLQIFSEVFGLPLPRLRQLAGLPSGERAPYEPPAEADRLSTRQRKAVTELIRLLVDTTEEAGGEHDQRSAPIAKQPTDADLIISRPDGTLQVVEVKSSPGVDRLHIEHMLPAGYHLVDVSNAVVMSVAESAAIQRLDWDEFLAIATASIPAGEVHDLSERRPTVPEKRVARRPSGPKQ